MSSNQSSKKLALPSTLTGAELQQVLPNGFFPLPEVKLKRRASYDPNAKITRDWISLPEEAIVDFLGGSVGVCPRIYKRDLYLFCGDERTLRREKRRYYFRYRPAQAVFFIKGAFKVGKCDIYGPPALVLRNCLHRDAAKMVSITEHRKVTRDQA